MQNNALVSVLLASEAKRIALVGEAVFRLEPMLQEACKASAESAAVSIACNKNLDECIEAVGSEQISTSDIAVCLHLPASSDSTQRLLGRACRQFPRLVLVEHTISQESDRLHSDEQFFAFGFRKLGQQSNGKAEQSSWYGYSLSDYKQPPDWLNARFWAHPERFHVTD